MFAIVDIKGSQYRIEEKQTIFVPRIDGETGSKVAFNKVLVYSADDKNVEVGTPILSRSIDATILAHLKDDKVIVFKKKRRKGYQITKGHRQLYTQIQIDKIN